MKTFSGNRARQQADELSAFIELMKTENVCSYLEVGACHGDTFHAVMSALPKGSKGVAIDLPEAAWGKKSSSRALEQAVACLRDSGYDADAIYGDSASADVRQFAQARGPYDAIFIDADHRYEAVRKDWLTYGPMGRIIAFHDIDGVGKRSGALTVEVPRLWREIAGQHSHREIIGGVRGMGIGVVWR